MRVQGAFLSDEEVEEIVDFVIAQQKAQYQGRNDSNFPMLLNKLMILQMSYMSRSGTA